MSLCMVDFVFRTNTVFIKYLWFFLKRTQSIFSIRFIQLSIVMPNNRNNLISSVISKAFQMILFSQRICIWNSWNARFNTFFLSTFHSPVQQGISQLKSHSNTISVNIKLQDKTFFCIFLLLNIHCMWIYLMW